MEESNAMKDFMRFVDTQIILQDISVHAHNAMKYATI